MHKITSKKLPFAQPSKNTLIFDLDETLIYCEDECVIVRPFMEESLQRLASYYNLWIWTASTKEYALPIIKEYVDPKGVMIKKILYREMCV